jgi:hypothetical protein
MKYVKYSEVPGYGAHHTDKRATLTLPRSAPVAKCTIQLVLHAYAPRFLAMQKECLAASASLPMVDVVPLSFCRLMAFLTDPSPSSISMGHPMSR